MCARDDKTNRNFVDIQVKVSLAGELRNRAVVSFRCCNSAMQLAVSLFALLLLASSLASRIPRDVPTDKSQIWAVLVAGSSEWYNYRHQADVCHAYQILHRHGIPDERIIVLMADDIANNSA